MTWQLALTSAAALLGLLACGYLLGRRDAVRVERKRRGGYITPQTPKQMVDRWNFPQAPRLFDQETETRASIGHPLVPDAPTILHRYGVSSAVDPSPESWQAVDAMAAALDATHEALDPHSRKVKP